MRHARADITAAVRQRIAAGLHLGLLFDGARLPSVRELAHEFGVMPRTIMRAYRELEAEDLVELRPRSGVFLAAGHTKDQFLLPHMAAWAVDTFVQGLAKGVAPVMLPEHLSKCLETVTLRAACIGTNNDQIHALCAELQEDYGFQTKGVDIASLTSRTKTEDEIGGADLLVTTSLHATQVRRIARRLRKPFIAISLRPDVRRRVLKVLESSDLYFVMTDVRFGDTLREVFGQFRGSHRIREIVVGRDDVAALPADAVVYLMQAAKSKLRKPLNVREVIYTPRVFSVESAREILGFIVKANIEAMQKAGITS